MSIALVAVLIIGGLVAAAAVAVLIPVIIGLVAYDITSSRNDVPVQVQVEDASMRIAVERGIARGFVLAGGAFWAIASFAGLYSFRETGVASALTVAFIVLAACAATLIVGWYFERTTAALLMLASLAVVVWGVVYQFEMGVWMLMTLALIGPMMTSAVLFWLARREQDAYELATALRPQVAMVFSARSTIA
jgi:hypothetical protein